MAPKKPSVPRQLKKYRAKRNFGVTSEPSGKMATPDSRNAYLIQKHAARRLHYDFRLEMNGVLKSWAVTRGPSLNHEDKRLAVHVEDHPLEYGSFEGTIPQGQYGGGTVMLWDTGRWESVGDPRLSYKKGNMTFEVHGRRLKGRWHLVRMHGRRARDQHDNWLLIKGKDKFADPDGDSSIKRYLTSVVTHRSMEQIANAIRPRRRGSATASKPKSTTANKKVGRSKKVQSFPPEFIAPQLATLVNQPPQGNVWLHEIKYDGYRLLARLDRGKATLNTRAHHDWTKKFKTIAQEIEGLGASNAYLDGEVGCVASDGSMSFHGLQAALSKGEEDSLHYFIFDLLYLNGEDFRQKPLGERKRALERFLNGTHNHLHYSGHFTEPGSKVLGQACKMSLEGIVSKRLDAFYRSGRDVLWLKSKCSKEQEVVIGGFTTQPAHPDLLGAILTGYYEKGTLVYAGKVGTGFSHKEGQDLLRRLKKLEHKAAPFENMPKIAKKGATWVAPDLVAQVHFIEWTSDGHMRHPSFLGLRDDKPAREVKREKTQLVLQLKAARPAPARPKGLTEKFEVDGVVLTHPDKVLYPNEKITKRDLALYYTKAASFMLPHVAGRPISILRCPDGMAGSCFFQRHGSETLSPHVKPILVEGHGNDKPFLMIENLQGLISLVQMGALEIHVWSCKAVAPEKPDRVVFDLDPSPDVNFSAVKRAALDIRNRLEKLKMKSFLKTTGGKGLHVVVPLSAGPDWPTVKNFARSFSQIMVEDDPEHFTINSRKYARAGKIFIDYFRNTEGASAIAPYSTRQRSGAPVALPLTWAELAPLKTGHEFSLKNIDRHLKNDPWDRLENIKQKLPSY